MEPLLFCPIPSPIGTLTAFCRGDALTHLILPERPLPEGGVYAPDAPLLLKAKEELCAYFEGELQDFSLPLAPKGTEFERKVWQALCTIPYGETRTYGEIAALAGSPRACRAVGMANHKNPLAIFIPCHRVVGAKGALTGYAGGLDAKRFLLDLESKSNLK